MIKHRILKTKYIIEYYSIKMYLHTNEAVSFEQTQTLILLTR